MQKFQLHNKE